MSDYTIGHWSTSRTVLKESVEMPVRVSVNNRAATRFAIISRLQKMGVNFVERSHWAAHKNRSENMVDDWNYSKIAIHHAGRSFSCGSANIQLRVIQNMHMNKLKSSMSDIGYHYALDCSGSVYEGRDIRFKGEHLARYNTGVIGIVLLQNTSDAHEGNDTVARVRGFLNKHGLYRTPDIPNAQKIVALQLISVLSDLFEIGTLGGHREFPEQHGEGKICPGNAGLRLVRSMRESTGLISP